MRTALQFCLLATLPVMAQQPIAATGSGATPVIAKVPEQSEAAQQLIKKVQTRYSRLYPGMPYAVRPTQLKADLTNAEVQEFDGWANFAMRVPADIKVSCVEESASYTYQFSDKRNRLLMTIYSGHDLTQHDHGQGCMAKIAGEEVRGSHYNTPTSKGQEYVLLKGKDGAAFHILVENTEYSWTMYSMLAGMSIQEVREVDAKTKAQAAYVFHNIASLAKQSISILEKVKDRRTADAAATQLKPIVDVLLQKYDIMDILVTKSGRALLPYLRTLEHQLPPDGEEVIRHLHEMDCYGSPALQDLLNSMLGI